MEVNRKGDFLNDVESYTNTLVKEILKAIHKKIRTAPFDRTVKCTVLEIMDGNKYKVIKNNATYIVPSHFTHQINDLVFVLLPQNSWSDARIIY